MSMRRRVAAIAAAAVLTAGFAGCDLREPPDRLEVGHVDGFAVHVEDDELHVHIHDDEADLERDPADTVLHARPGTQTEVPPLPEYSFLGPVGSPVWILPQVQDPDLLWLGWETEEIAPGVLQGDQLTWHLLGVDGPGEMQIFTNGPFGEPNIIFNSADGTPDSTIVATGSHVHGNWSFNAAGQYRVTFEATATLADGTDVSSGPVDYHFTIGSHECADVDDVLVAPDSAAAGEAVDVAYSVTNCGTDADELPVRVSVVPDADCGLPTTSQTVPESLEPGASAQRTVQVTAPDCAGDHLVRVKTTADVANSYADEAQLAVP